MIMSAIASETFMNYEFIYYSDEELATLLMKLRNLERMELVKEVSVCPGHVRDGKGSVFACIRCSAVESLYYTLEHELHSPVSREVQTIHDDYIPLDEDLPF